MGKINFNNRNHILILFTLLFGIISLFLGLHIHTQQLAHTKHELQHVLFDKMSTIQSLLNQEISIIHELAKTPAVIETLDKTRNNSATQQNVKQKNDSLVHTLTNIKDKKNYLNISLVTTKGDVVFSLKNNELKNVVDGPVSILNQSFIRSRMSLTTDISEFGYFEGMPTYFITIPILKKNMLIGLIYYKQMIIINKFFRKSFKKSLKLHQNTSV